MSILPLTCENFPCMYSPYTSCASGGRDGGCLRRSVRWTPGTSLDTVVAPCQSPRTSAAITVTRTISLSLGGSGGDAPPIVRPRAAGPRHPAGGARRGLRDSCQWPRDTRSGAAVAQRRTPDSQAGRQPVRHRKRHIRRLLTKPPLSVGGQAFVGVDLPLLCALRKR